jgi:hypothetical protein
MFLHIAAEAVRLFLSISTSVSTFFYYYYYYMFSVAYFVAELTRSLA